ncbi:TPA: hypothetical protein ACHWY1_004899, partial [Escherichia coli]
VTLFLFAVSLLPASVLAWNTPGEDFSGALKLEGMVSSARNPWVWEVGQGNENLDVEPQIRRGGGTVAMPAITILRGKTILTTPAGREGLSPRVSYGKGEEGFSLVWTDVGIADVTPYAEQQVKRRLWQVSGYDWVSGYSGLTGRHDAFISGAEMLTTQKKEKQQIAGAWVTYLGDLRVNFPGTEEPVKRWQGRLTPVVVYF